MYAQPETIASLRTPEAVRTRCNELLSIGENGNLTHFAVDIPRLAATAQLVADNIRFNYPSLDIPYHSRWRHFEVAGDDRWLRTSTMVREANARELGRARFDAAIISVLLDAGAGPCWSYRDRYDGRSYSRSEGLALASLELLETGMLSSRQDEPVRADAEILRQLDVEHLRRAFQLRPDNPLIGVEGRVALLRSLGEVVLNRVDVFGTDEPRVGRLFDYLYEQSVHGELAARQILIVVLDVFSPIWPSRLKFDNVDLGDVWRHSAIRRVGDTDALLPLHKLSQWLTYSLLEPLEEAGLLVTGLDALTGLAEYRNGGLFLDTEVLTLRDCANIELEHEVSSELVVEWRALTVALLDRLVPLVRELLNLHEQQLPLARVLQGGTWNTGRVLASKLRANGAPPLRIVSDGTVF